MGLIINNEPIDAAVVEQEFVNIKSAYEALDPNIQCCERDEEFRGYAEENIVARVLLTQEASRRVEPISEAEVAEALDELKAEHGGEEAFYRAFGIAADQEGMVRRDIELNLRVRKLVEQAGGPAAEPTDAQLRAYYEAHIGDFMTAERVRAAHILKAPTRSEEREEAYDELRRLRERLLDGADFFETARAHSDKAHELEDQSDDGDGKPDPDAGIDLGLFQRGELMEEFERVAFSMRVGETSPVFATSFGFHLLRLTDREPAAPKPFDEVRDEVRRAYAEEEREQRIRALVDELKAKASIESVEEDGEEV